MFKHMTVGKKIVSGFSSVLIILAAVGLIAYNALDGASKGFTHYREMARDTNLAGRLQANMLMVRMNVKDFIITGSEKDQKQYADYFHKMEGFLKEAQVEIQDPQRAEKIDQIDVKHIEYDKAFHEVVALQAERNKGVLEGLVVVGPKVEKSLTAIMTSAEADGDARAAYFAGLALRNFLLARLYAQKFLDTNGQEHVDRVDKEFATMKEQLDILDRELQNPERRRHLAETVEGHEEYHRIFNLIVEDIFKRNTIITETLDRIGPEIAGLVEEVKLDIKAVQDDLGPKLVASNARSNVLITVIGIVAILLGIVLSFIITRSITKPLNRTIQGLGEGADQVSSASGQISSSSQQLAEGASEQAASIEETSSSLEEMSSMTEQNANSARQADSLMKESNQVVAQANDSMAQLTESMQDISKASEETSKIIKTIDEIAFQTNLLALNAAVEAARAGEAGAGFAVVADEVRNLAMRAADAAKDTSELIEGTVKRVNDGSQLVAKTNESFTNVATSSAKVGELVSEIAAASNEQAQGIVQVNTAVSEMDKVVQSNASNAEENASASEEMNAQAEQMMAYVGDLSAMVGASSNNAKNGRSAVKHIDKVETQLDSKSSAVHQPKENKAEQLIPMADDDFGDF